MEKGTEKFVLIVLLVVLLIATFGSFQYVIHDFPSGGWNLEHPVGYAGFRREQLFKFAVVAVPACLFVLCYLRFLNVRQSQEQDEDALERTERQKQRIEAQLRQLESLYQSQSISDLEYQQKKSELLLRL